MNWLEVSLTVSGEAAEAVADVFARFAPGGVVHEATQIEVTPDDKGRPVGPVIVRAYLPADEGLAAARAQLEEALWHLGQILPLPQPQYRPVAEADWSEAWKADFKPIRIGKRLVIVPAWLNPPLAPDDVPIRLDPGMAFGTGTHPTTQLCLAAIERHLKPGSPVIDLGTGSGILAIAAAKLGAGPLLAVDIDDEAVRVAKENAAANGVADHIHIEKGSLAEVLAHQFGMASAPFVVANILARVIINLLTEGLGRTLAPSGLLILSGILAEQEPSVVDALRSAGCKVVEQRQSGDWIALAAKLVTT